MYNKFKKSLLLYQISTEDVQVLLNDLELEKKGYVINYIIDPYDIFRFSFPYGIKFGETATRSLDEIGDEMLAYTHLFDNNKPVLLDEYEHELFTNREQIQKHRNDILSGNIFTRFLENYNSLSEEKKEKALDELRQTLSFLLASSVIKDTFADKCEEICKKLQINDFVAKTPNKKDENLILEAFKNNRRTKWSEEAFISWVTTSDKDGDFENSKDISNELEAAFRDFVAVDRICNLNKDLQQNNLSKKNLFLYFSSARKSEKIFSTEMVKKHLPIINGESYNVLRQAKHSFIMFLLGGQSPEKIIEALKTLKGITEKWEKETDIKKEINNDNKTWLDDWKQARRNQLEDDSIKRQINKHINFQEAIKSQIRLLEGKNHTEFIEYFKNLLLESENAKSSEESLGEMDRTYSIEFGLAKLLKIVNEEKLINIHKGKDSIFGSYHHLPILLFLTQNDKVQKELRNLLHELIGFIVKSPQQRQKNEAEFFKSLNNVYNKAESIYRNDEKLSPATLLQSLVYLILPFENQEQQEVKAFGFVWDKITLSGLSGIGKEKKLTHTFKYFNNMTVPFKIWKADYQYFLIWSSRRKNDIDESLAFAEEAIKEYPKDPRFYHGKCLALYNKFVDKDTLKVGNSDDLMSLVIAAEDAIKRYESICESNYDVDDETDSTYIKFIEGTIIVLKNTILYCLCLQHLESLELNINNSIFSEKEFSKYTLTYLRDYYLEDMKKFINQKDNQNAQDYPEFAHTEAVLVLCEAIYDFRKKKKSVKIKEAEEVITKALKLEPNDILFLATEEKIKKWDLIITRMS
jgi:hypothetical protein